MKGLDMDGGPWKGRGTSLWFVSTIVFTGS